MPRPYGLILGEGVYGMTRRGVGITDASGSPLESITDNPFTDNSSVPIMAYGSPGYAPGETPANIGIYPHAANTFNAFLQQYGSWLLIGGIVLFLMKRK